MFARSSIAVLCGLMVLLSPVQHELQKLPGLIEHYYHHVEQHGQPDLGVLDFLADHFGDRDHHESEHGNLPFHGSHLCHTHVAGLPVRVPSVSAPVTALPVATGERPQWQPEPPTTSIFQPPRA